MKTELKVCVNLMAVFGALALQAKTLALWPIDYDIDNQEYNLRCATDAKYDLAPMTASKSFSTLFDADTLPWNLPPNPDGSAFRFTPYTYTSLGNTTDGYLQAQVGDMLSPEKVYTVEGYVKFTGTGTLGTGADWVVLVNIALNATQFRQQLRMQNVSGKDEYHLHLWAPTASLGAGLDADFPDLTFTLAAIRDGKWHHFAYSQLPNDGAGHRIFKAYWDGVCAGTLQDNNAVTTTHTKEQGILMLGARLATGLGSGNTVKGALDYVRVSNEVLTQERFLNAGGGSGTVVTAPATKTIGYWRLGKDANGGVDGSSSIGAWPFVRSYWGSTDCRTTLLTADPEGAFEGQPPNPTVTIDGGNKGSFAVNWTSTRAVVTFPELSPSLVPSKDFSVELYFRPDHRVATETGSRSVLGSFGGTGNLGWILYLCTNARSSANYGRRFRLVARDAAGDVHYHVDFGGAISGWNDEWKHLALVHKATGGANGFGSWTLYLDGRLYGTLNDARQLGDPAASTFRLGTCDYQSALGKFDCLRVSESALSPDQFICAKDGSAATGVKAFFPLDISANGGAYSVFTDVVGTSSKGTVLAANSVAVATDDGPVVTNPDKSPSFRSSAVTGSLGFGGYAVDAAYPALYCADSAVLNSLNAEGAGREYTIEAYVKQEDATTAQQIFVASDKILSADFPAMQLRIAYGSDGFVLSDQISQQPAGAGKNFRDMETGVKIPANEWHHFAMTCSVYSEGGADYGLWKLYIDGVEKYSSASEPYEYKISKNRYLDGMDIGGRHWANSAFKGKIAHLRISKGVLDSSEFLCATPVSQPAVTTAFWPLDFKNGVIDPGNRVNGLQPFSADAAVGSTERAVYRPVTATVPAEGARNVGSVRVSSACLASLAAADEIGNLGKPFTVEGYLKWTGSADESRQVVCGTYRNGHGWKLILDNTGASPVFRVYGCGRLPTSAFVNAVFDYEAVGFANAWRHVAVAYDPAESGVWSLYVDGVLAGKVANRWNPNGIDIRQPTFLLGADASDGDASFVGGLDLWRISVGTRAVSEFLYPGLPVPGMLLLFK